MTRVFRLVLGLAVVLASGCKLSPAKSCTKDSDCDPSTGGYCDVAHQVCMVNTVTDGGRLGLVVVAPTPSSGDAFLRGDVVQVAVSTSVANPALTWTIQGVLADGSAAPAVTGNTSASATTCPSGSSAVSCANIAVDLSVPVLQGLTGTFKVSVTAKDAQSHQDTQTATLNVTRLAWQQNLGGAIVASPAVGDDGTVYVGVADGGARLAALNPDGTTKWSYDGVKVIASPAVGHDAVYAAGEKADGGSNLWALSGAGGLGAECPSSASYDKPFFASLNVSVVKGKETAFGLSNDDSGSELGKLQPITPTAATGLGCNGALPGAGTTFVGATLLSASGDLVFGDNSGHVYAYPAANLSDSSGWPSGNVAAGTGPMLGLGIEDASVIGSTKTFGGFALALADGSSQGKSPDSDVGANPGSVAIASDNSIYFGTSTNSLLKVKIPGTAALATATTLGPVTAAPLLGQGGHIYTASGTGALQVWDSNLTAEWSASLNSNPGGFFASPNIDCARYSDGGTRSGPGTLYLAAVDGTVYAIQVDSHGLDTSAPWPRYQHDARSTGNADTGLVSCP